MILLFFAHPPVVRASVEDAVLNLLDAPAICQRDGCRFECLPVSLPVPLPLKTGGRCRLLFLLSLYLACILRLLSLYIIVHSCGQYLYK